MTSLKNYNHILTDRRATIMGSLEFKTTALLYTLNYRNISTLNFESWREGNRFQIIISILYQIFGCSALSRV